MTYGEALAWLYGQQLHGIKLGLETMRQLCASLGVDLASERSHRSTIVETPGLHARGVDSGTVERPFFVHVAGTNGKGSVCAMLAAIYRAAGLRTGLYTSPHLVSFRERIRLDGEMIPEQHVADGLSRVRTAAERFPDPATFFEIVTALALDWFQERRAHVVVLETGLGGRLDATNVITPAVSVLTSIDFDHERYLGATLAEIAAEKCGIIKPGVPVISAPQKPVVREIIQTVAAARGSEVFEVDGELEPEWPVGLTGVHQRWNAALARAAVEVAATKEPFLTVPVAKVQQGLGKVEWPGRFQRIGDRIILDGAHNPAAATALATTWREVFGGKKATVILGVMRDKNVRGVITALGPIALRIIAVRVENERSCQTEELLAVAREVLPEIALESTASLHGALRRAESFPDPILIAGSLFLVGEALAVLGVSPAVPERSEQ